MLLTTMKIARFCMSINYLSRFRGYETPPDGKIGLIKFQRFIKFKPNTEARFLQNAESLLIPYPVNNKQDRKNRINCDIE